MSDTDILLTGFLQNQSSQPFIWGENDCCLMAAGWLALHDDCALYDVMKGRYHTAQQAAAFWQELGRSEHLAVVMRRVLLRYGYEMGQGVPDIGDIILVRSWDVQEKKNTHVAGIVGQKGRLWYQGAVGLQAISNMPFDKLQAGWPFWRLKRRHM